MSGSTTNDLRQMYRTAIKEDLPSTIKVTIGDRTIEYEKVTWNVSGTGYKMRYGTNPHQKAGLFRPKNYKDLFFSNIEWLKMGKEGPSATNLEDGYRGLKICSYFRVPAVSIMKHTNPCGVAIGIEDKTNLEVFEDAWSSEPRAAYGSVDCFNFPVTEDIAKNITSKDKDKFIECLFATDYDQGALNLLKEKKQMRIAKVPDIEKIKNLAIPYEIKFLGDTILVEDVYHSNISNLNDLKQKQVATKREPTEKEWEQLYYSWIVCMNKRSNGVVNWKNNKVLAVGTGQQDRIGAIEIAIARAERVGHDMKDSVFASDGFMLEDNIEPLGKRGVTAIVQPGGSIKDEKVIEAADNYEIAMVFTGERCFRHF